jgi:hypothetical protein
MAYDELTPAEVDRLADYLGGALDAPEQAEVARLIADDPRWRETYELLAPGMATVTRDLRAIGSAAEPMPADLVTRLDAAFAAAPGPERHLSVVAGGEQSRPSRPRRRLRWAVPVAAAAGLLAFAGFGADYLANRSGAQDNAASSAAGSAEQAAPMMGTDAGAGAAPAVRDDQILESGTNYTAATLAAAPAFAAGAHGVAPKTDASRGRRVSEFGGRELDRLRSRDALQACLDAIAQAAAAGPITVETVDYARYSGRSAVVVRFTAGTTTWAYAVGPNCGTRAVGADLVQRVQVR